MSLLFEKSALGKIELKNRVVMAPMTRSRAIGNVPNDLMVEHYAPRADAGLIITEGASPSPNGLGYARIPGIFNNDQVKGWKKVTDAVHARGGRIFIQLMHTGRVSHQANMPHGSKILAPSAIALSGNMWTDSEGMKPHPVPSAMTLEEVRAAIAEFGRAAELAVEAGFDGVELHAANGYLLEQFLNANSNHRSDEYGGTPEKRMKFVLEVAALAAKKIGGDKVGIRVSPYGVFNDTGAFDGIDEFYARLSAELSKLGLVYIHVVDHSAMGAPQPPDVIKKLIRDNFKGSYILSGGYDAKRAERDLVEKKGDLVAFGRPFMSNPNLVEKLKTGAPLVEPDMTKAYTPGPEGYNDYK